MTDTQIRILSPMELKDQQNAALRMQIINLTEELNHYRDANQSPSWLQRKVVRQASSLTFLNKRVRFQRAMLRALNEQHPDIADSIFQTAKVSVPLEEGETITF